MGFTGANRTAADLILARDAADTLAQRNSTNAQTFNIYNTYTDASNYERAGLKWNANVFEFASEAAGTGTARDFSFTGGNVGIGTNIPGTDLEVLGAAKVYDTSSGSTLLTLQYPDGSSIDNAIDIRRTGFGGDAQVGSGLAVAFTNRNAGGLWTSDYISNKVLANDTVGNIVTSGYEFAAHVNQLTGNAPTVVVAINDLSATLHVDSPSTTTNAFQIEGDTVTTGNVIDVANADSLTTGSIMDLVSNSADTGTRSLVKIHNDNALATNTTPLEVINDAGGTALSITGELQVSDGSTIDPSIHGSQPTAGLAFYGSGYDMVYVRAGSPMFALSFNKVALGSGGQYVWTNGSASGGTADTGLKRDSAGVAKVTDGSTGNGSLIAKDLEVAEAYTVATLPAGTVGQIARVTDGDTGLAWGDIVVSGSPATPYLVWYNGTNWTVMGK
jgi:hypothetical protein